MHTFNGIGALYSRISSMGPEGHFTSRFKRVMCNLCLPHVDVQKGTGPAPVDACRQE